MGHLVVAVGIEIDKHTTALLSSIVRGAAQEVIQRQLHKRCRPCPTLEECLIRLDQNSNGSLLII